MQHAELTHQIIGCAMKVHGALGPGFLESVYKNALAHELRGHGLRVALERHVPVHYDGVLVVDFVADVLVEDLVIVEIKAVRTLATAHEVQLVNYLTATGLDVGLLINFGAPRLEYKRKQRTLAPDFSTG